MLKKIVLALKRLAVFHLALMMLLASHVAAQESRGGNGTDDEAAESAAERALEKKAVELLEETVREAAGLKLAENRLRVQTIAAGLLWPRDEEAARAVFKLAADGIAALIAESDPTDPQHQNDRSVIFQLRHQLVTAAASHDPKLALEFLRATRQPPPFSYPDSEYKQADQELLLETQLATLMATQDSKQALRLAEESLGRGFSQGLVGVFHQLSVKDKEAAARLATEIVKRLRAEEVVRDFEMWNVAQTLLLNTRGEAAAASVVTPVEKLQTVNDVTSNRIEVAGNADGKVLIEERVRRQLVETLVAAALLPNAPRGNGVQQMIVQALFQVLPEVERYTPARVAALKRRAETATDTDPRTRMWKEFNETMQNAPTIEAQLEAAPKVPHEMRDQLYVNVAYRVLGEHNDLERARAIAENIVSPERRAQLLRELERQHRMNAAQRGDFQTARQVVALTKGLDEKVQLLVNLAATAQGRGDKVTARELLEEARSLSGRGETSQQFHALLNVANAYAALDESVSYEMIGGAIDRLNELLTAAVVVDGFGQDAFKDGELRQSGGYMWNELIGNCAQGLANLADTDFDRARTLAQKFERPDARTHAQLLLAQTILENIPTVNEDGSQNLPIRRRIFRGGKMYGRN